MSLLKRFFGENHPVKKETSEDELGVGGTASTSSESHPEEGKAAGTSEEIANGANGASAQAQAEQGDEQQEPHTPTPEEIQQQQEEMAKKAFLYMESAFRSQEVTLREHLEIPRSNTEHHVSLREVLNNIYPDLIDRYGDKVMLSRIEKDTVLSEGVLPMEDFLDHSPFMFVFQTGEDGTTSVIDLSTVLSLEIKGENGKSSYLNVCVKPLGTTAHSVYLRMTLMKPHEGKDDLLTTRSACMPEVTSVLMVYDVLDPAEDIKFYEEIEADAVKDMKEHKQLNPYQDEVLHGMTGIRHPSYNVKYGRWLLENKRFYDAYMVFLRAYNCIKPEFSAVPKEIKTLYFQACYGLGLSMLNLGFLEKAAYYLQLAMEDNQQFIGAYVEALGLASHNRVNFFLNQLRSQAAQSKPAAKELQRMENLVKMTEANYKVPASLDMSTLPLGYVLTNWFNLDQNCVIGATVTPTAEGAEIRTVQSREEVWNLNLYDLKDSVVYLRYTHSHFEMGETKDQSTLCHHHCMVLNVQSVESEGEKAYVRVNVVVPNVANNDEKWIPGPCNIPMNASFILGAESNQKQFTSKELKEVYAESIALKDAGCILEAMRGFEFVHNALKIDYTKVSATDEDEELFFDATFELGYCLVELGLYEKATYYLDWAQEGFKVDYAREYVNCLCNNFDHRALDVIDNLIKNMTKPTEDEYQDAYQYFIAFMQRRKAYVLINRRMFDDAESLLKEMLNDPLSKEYAEHELQFLSQIKK